MSLPGSFAGAKMGINQDFSTGGSPEELFYVYALWTCVCFVLEAGGLKKAHLVILAFNAHLLYNFIYLNLYLIILLFLFVFLIVF